MKPRKPPPTKTEKETSHTPVEQTPKPLALTLDLELYLGQLEDWDISKKQKIEFISTFWNLLLNFAEIGFGIHPAQQAQNKGRKKSKKPPENRDKSQEIAEFLPPDMLCSNLNQRTRIIAKTGAHSALDIEDSKQEGTRA